MSSSSSSSLLSLSSTWSYLRSLTSRVSSQSQSRSQPPSAKHRWNRVRKQSQTQSRRPLTDAAATALFSVLAISPPNAKTLVKMAQDYPSLISNVQYMLSPLGTLGPATLSYMKPSTKGERSLSRFRLEFCPATADSIAAGCKPKEHSLTTVKEPTICSHRCVSAFKQCTHLPRNPVHPSDALYDFASREVS